MNQPVEVTNLNIDDLKITLRPAVAIRATVTMLEDEATPPEHVSFRAVPVEPGLPADPSDSLYIRGLPPGQYWPTLSLSAGCAVTEVMYRSRPVYNAPILIEAEESTVTFTVTSRTAAINGVVRDANQNPVPHAVVVVSPYPAPVQTDPFSERRFRANSGANGTFRIPDLAPGSYIVTSGSGDGQKVDLDFGQMANMDLQIR